MTQRPLTGCCNAPSIDQVIDIIILMYCTVINTQLTHHFSFAPTHPGYIGYLIRAMKCGNIYVVSKLSISTISRARALHRYINCVLHHLKAIKTFQMFIISICRCKCNMMVTREGQKVFTAQRDGWIGGVYSIITLINNNTAANFRRE